MAITLIAVVVALVLGHLSPALAAAVRQHAWFDAWLRWLDARLAHGAAWTGPQGLLIGLAPPLLAIALLQWAMHAPLWGIGDLLLGVAVLFYCWGPRDLDVDVAAILDATDPASRAVAIQALVAQPGDAGGATGAPIFDAPSPRSARLVEALFDNALQRWFGVLFWFLLLGPFGALLYRLAVLAACGDARRALSPRAADAARRLLQVLDWPVAQLMTLSMALVGNFDTVVAAWKDAGGGTAQLSSAFLGAAGRASVRSELRDAARENLEAGLPPLPMGELPDLRDAMSLAWRILLVWMVALALFVIAGFVG